MLMRRVLAVPMHARHMSTGGVQKLGVIGLGLMGHGIAQTAAASGITVVAVESNPDALARGIGMIDTSLKKVAGSAVKKGKMTQEEADANAASTSGLITGTTDHEQLADCDMIIEAIIEDYSIKNPMWENLGKMCNPDTIFASNTSSLSITKQALASGRPDKFCGLHYFNPVQVMKLVEIVRTDHTSEETYQTAKQFVQTIKKTGITCKDTPGFVVNRLLVPYMAQAIALVERGDATPEDVDIAMQLGAGHPMGPIHLSDYVGNDINNFVLQGWVDNFPEEPAFMVPELLKQKIAANELGRKAGKGFYEWDSPTDTFPKHMKKK